MTEVSQKISKKKKEKHFHHIMMVKDEFSRFGNTLHKIARKKKQQRADRNELLD